MDAQNIECHFNPYYASGQCGKDNYINSVTQQQDLILADAYAYYGIDLVELGKSGKDNPLSINNFSDYCNECVIRILTNGHEVDLAVVLISNGLKSTPDYLSNYEPNYMFFIIKYHHDVSVGAIYKAYFSPMWLVNNIMQNGPGDVP